MRRFIGLLFGLSSVLAAGQTTNPQNTFANAEFAANPSLVLNFDDPTTSFKDQVSGKSFNQTNVYPYSASHCNTGATTASTISCSVTANPGDILLVLMVINNGTNVTSLIDSGGAASVLIGGATSTDRVYYFQNVSAGSHTITLTMSASVSSGFPYMNVIDLTGVATSSPIDASAFATGAVGSTQALTITTTTANDILVGGFFQLGAGGTWTFPAGSTFSQLAGFFPSNVNGISNTAGAGTYTFSAVSTVSLGSANSLIAIKLGSPTPVGTVISLQPGFDSNNANNTSAAFSYNAWNAATTTTVGAFDWFQPATILVHVDKFNWNRTGSLILASKGDLGGCVGAGASECSSLSSVPGPSWQLSLRMSGLISQLCFTRMSNGIASTAGAPSSVQQSLCTNGGFDAMPNGFNYDIVVEDLGTGGTCNQTTCTDINIWLNGLPIGPGSTVTASALAINSFGAATLNASGGTGYASSTVFTSSGGGPNCSVTGNLLASGGVPLTNNGISFTTNFGCTSVPTITLTSPTGTGVTLKVGLTGASMQSSVYPLMVPGYVSNGAYFGVAGTNSSQTPTYVDEFAVFPAALSFGQISDLFYETKFYEGVLNPVTTPPVLVFDNDGCSDLDNEFSLQMSIALHQYGAAYLAGVVSEDPSTTCEALWRQMLDQAGLNSIPLSVPNIFTAQNSGTTESAGNIASYNTSTPLSNAAWKSAVTMYRTIFAQYPKTPIDIVSGAGMTAIAEFMESPADSISPMTGLQLMTQNAVNGGAIYAEGGGCTASSPPATVPCTGGIGGNLAQDYPSAQFVLTHNGALPIYWIGGTPQSAGPGVLSTRTGKDPMFLLTTTLGTDVRECFDCLAVEAAVSSLFADGVQIGFSGGTGYAASTPFTLTGGGPNCQGSGFMTASSGVPNGVEFNWGANAVGNFAGIGSGCTSAPKVNLVGATGTGVTLTAYPTAVCGTDTVTETGSTGSDSFSSATCSNHFISPYTVNANQSPLSGALMEWFINSLVDPPPTGQVRTY
jgi:hypothetical protein